MRAHRLAGHVRPVVQQPVGQVPPHQPPHEGFADPRAALPVGLLQYEARAAGNGTQIRLDYTRQACYYYWPELVWTTLSHNHHTQRCSLCNETCSNCGIGAEATKECVEDPVGTAAGIESAHLSWPKWI